MRAIEQREAETEYRVSGRRLAAHQSEREALASLRERAGKVHRTNWSRHAPQRASAPLRPFGR